MDEKPYWVVAGILVIVQILVWLAAVGTVIFVAHHFIAKYW